MTNAIPCVTVSMRIRRPCLPANRDAHGQYSPTTSFPFRVESDTNVL